MVCEGYIDKWEDIDRQAECWYVKKEAVEVHTGPIHFLKRYTGFCQHPAQLTRRMHISCILYFGYTSSLGLCWPFLLLCNCKVLTVVQMLREETGMGVWQVVVHNESDTEKLCGCAIVLWHWPPSHTIFLLQASLIISELCMANNQPLAAQYHQLLLICPKAFLHQWWWSLQDIFSLYLSANTCINISQDPSCLCLDVSPLQNNLDQDSSSLNLLTYPRWRPPLIFWCLTSPSASDDSLSCQLTATSCTQPQDDNLFKAIGQPSLHDIQPPIPWLHHPLPWHPAHTTHCTHFSHIHLSPVHCTVPW